MNQNEQDPMPLNNLPEYLEEQRKNGTDGPAPVVGMGNIVVPKKKRSWLPLTAIAMVILGVSSIVVYDKATTKQFTVIVESNGGIKEIPTIMSEGEAEIVSLEQKSDTGYKVKINTKKNKKTFLDWLRRNKNINKADIEE